MPTTWHPVELSLAAEDPPGNPYVETQFEARFEHESGTPVTVPGFWDGGDAFRVRFAPPTTGKWTWRTAADGLDVSAPPFDGDALLVGERRD